MNQPAHNKLQKGFSLVELMIALTLGLLLTAAIGALFYTNKKNFTQNSLIAEMQDNARFALETISRDLSMAGYLGGITDNNFLQRDSASLGTPGNDCSPGADGQPGWAFDVAALEFLNNASASTAQAQYGCLPSGGFQPATDLLAVRRVSGQATAERLLVADAVNLDPNTYYLRSNRTQGSLFFSGGSAEDPTGNHPPELPPYTVWEYISRLYFVRSYAETPGDGIPSLCRAVLTDSATPNVEIEVIAEGVEDLQLAFGIDSDGDGVANRYEVAPSDEQLLQAVTARVQLLVRSVRPDFSYRNDKTYRLISKSDQSYTQGNADNRDHFYRRVIQTTVVLRNPALALGLAP